MVLIDTSSWIDSLRERGRKEVRQRVADLMNAGNAAWCDVVRVELWNGVRGDRERKLMAELETIVPSLPVDQDVWTLAVELAKKARAAGLNLPSPDLIIVACAQRHKVSVEHADKHLERLLALV